MTDWEAVSKTVCCGGFRCPVSVADVVAVVVVVGVVVFAGTVVSAVFVDIVCCFRGKGTSRVEHSYLMSFLKHLQ